jgi:hypothetical protein
MKYHKIPALGSIMEFQKQDLAWMQDGLAEGINGLLSILGTGNYIISGVAVSGTQLTDGWIYYNGELLRFKGGAINTKFVIIDAEQTEGTDDYEKYATPGSNVGAITLSTLVRLDKIQEIVTKIQVVQEDIASLSDNVASNLSKIDDNTDAILTNAQTIINHDHDGDYAPKDISLSKFGNGFWDLGNGLQIRWGTWLSNTDDDKSVYFAKAFSSSCFVVVTDEWIWDNSTVKYTNRFIINRSNDVDGDKTRNYIAIGY